MKNPTVKKALWLSIVVSVSFITGLAQSVPESGGSASPSSKPPLTQQIQVHNSPAVSSTPYVRKTSIATSTALPEAEMVVPGYSGILVEMLDGKVVSESLSNTAFNPASNVKIATAYAVLKTFGPEFRFATDVWTDGTIDKTTGTLYGNLYVSGRDPMFNPEHALVLAYELNRIGIRTVSGDMVVTDNFSLGYSSSAVRSGQSLFAMMDMAKRSPAATRAWINYVSYSGRYNQTPITPSVTFTGTPYVQSIPSNLKLLFRHESAPLREIIKVTLCYSNNFLSERLGDMIGGPYAVARTVHLNAGFRKRNFTCRRPAGSVSTASRRAP